MARRPGSNAWRDRAGVTITLEHREDRRTVTVVHDGPVRRALGEALEPYLPTEWRVRCISTPRTILADLRIRPQATGALSRRGFDGTDHATTYRNTPEANLLGVIGRPEYL